MPVNEPFPELDEVIASIGAAGHRIAAIDASEGAAGNISVCLGWPVEVRRRFPLEEPIELPVPAPSLAGRTVIVTGSGRRLRALVTDPDASLGAVLVDEGGRTGTLFTSRRRLFERVTSEWNSHLAVHEDVIGRTRHELPGDRPRPAAAPDVPQPRARLPGPGLRRRAAAAMGAGDPRRVPGGDRDARRSPCPAPRS